jgi:hypothetical protein
MNKDEKEMIKKYEKEVLEEFNQRKDKLIWDKISCDPNLSDDFIIENEDKLNWRNISFNHELDYSFITKFEKRLVLEEIFSNRKISDALIEEYLDKVSKTAVYDLLKEGKWEHGVYLYFNDVDPYLKALYLLSNNPYIETVDIDAMTYNYLDKWRDRLRYDKRLYFDYRFKERYTEGELK